MRIHRVRGRSLAEALERARMQHGEAALVLSQESADNGDVLLSVSERRQASSRVFEKLSTAAATAAPVPAPLPARPAAAPRVGPLPEEPGAGDVRARLLRSGTSAAWVERVLETVSASGARGAFAIDAAARDLAGRVRLASSPRADGRTRAIAFVGPTGVGKTTTLAKLASRLVRAGRRVGLVTTDTHRVGAFEQLASYAKMLQCPAEVARGGDELAAVAARSAHLDALLIDTTGRSPGDAEALTHLARSLDSARATAPLETYLVLAASASREALERAAVAFASANPSAAILTKLDETRAPAPALELASATGEGVLFLCDGQDLAAHLTRATAEAAADLFLRGRLP